MQICISHQTALSYLLRVPCLRGRRGRASRASVVPSTAPDSTLGRRLLEALGSSLPEGADCVDVLVSRAAGRRQSSCVRTHVSTTELPGGSFIPADAYGLEFHVCSPELVFLQMAGELELDHLIYVGYALCSSFRLDNWEVGGCVYREGHDAPLTSAARIRSYLEKLPEGTWSRAVALRALAYVRDGARSPREAGLAMAIGLPVRLGGFALGEVEMNRPIKMYDGTDARGEARWVTRIPDILVTARDRRGDTRVVGVDFDAEATHFSPERVIADIDRRNLMAPKSGFTHITISSVQVRNYVAFRREMDRIRRALGQREKPHPGGSATSLQKRRAATEARSRQFELWDRVLGSQCPSL